MNPETSVATPTALKAALEAGPTKLETVLGGVDIEVGHLDGTTEKVKVRQLPVKDYKSALKVLAHEVQFIALVVDRNPVWVEDLHPRSFTRLAEAAEEQNADFFAWSARQTRRVEMLTPGAMGRAVTKAMADASTSANG